MTTLPPEPEGVPAAAWPPSPGTLSSHLHRQVAEGFGADAGRYDRARPTYPAGLISRPRDGVRLLGKGDLKAKLSIEVAGASKSAIAMVEKAGGSVKVTRPVKEEVPRGPSKAELFAKALAEKAAKGEEKPKADAKAPLAKIAAV